MFQTNIEVQYGIIYPIYTVRIGDEKETGEIEYDLQAPLVAYHQNASSTCCFISLESAVTVSGERNAARMIAMIIEESLHFQYQGYKYIIAFANSIMSYQVRNPGERRLHCNTKKWKIRANLTFFITSVKTLPWYS